MSYTTVSEFFAKYALDAKICDADYKLLEQDFFSVNPQPELQRRLDSRTIREFAKSLKAHTLKETYLILLFKDEMELLGHSVEIKDNGIDNEGNFIAVADKSVSQSDFQVRIDGKTWQRAEVKNSPSRYKTTFKLCNLKSYVEQNAVMILFYGTGRLENDFSKLDVKNTRWALLTTEQIKNLLTLPTRRYWEIGNKTGVQLTEKDFRNYFTPNKLNSLSCNTVE